MAYNNDSEDIAKIIKKVTLSVLAIILVVSTAFSSFYTVNSGEEAVLLTFGKADVTAIQPGLHFKYPFIQSVVKFGMTTRKYGADATGSSLESAASSDLQIVKANIDVNYHLQPSSTPTIYTKLGPNYEGNIITPTVHEVLKATTAHFSATELITKREEVSLQMNALLKEKLLPYNIVVEQALITKFDFSEQFNNAIEAKVTAEQQKEKAANDLERIKIEAQQVAAQGQGQADSELAIAKAQAQAIDLINQQLQRSPNYIELQRVQKWDGKYPSFYMTGGSSPNLLLNIPSITNGSN